MIYSRTWIFIDAILDKELQEVPQVDYLPKESAHVETPSASAESAKRYIWLSLFAVLGE